MGNDDPVFLASAQGIESRRWAKTVLPDYQPAKAGKATAKAPRKRQRSAEDTATQVQQAKRTKTLSNRSFAEVARGKTLIGVLDRGSKDGQIPRDKWHLVENELQDRFLQELEENGGPPPKCEDAGGHQGRVKAIACQDARSAALYAKAVASLKEVYPGAQLEVVKWEDIPSKPRARAWVSAKPAEPDKILRILQVCNPHLPTADWKVAKVEESNGQRRQIILVLNEESVRLLHDTEGAVDYGYKKVVVVPYKSDSKGMQPTVEPDLEPPEIPSMEIKPAVSDVASVVSDDILDGYVSDVSDLTRDLKHIGVAEELDSSETDHDRTMVEVNLRNVTDTPADKPPPL
ncbi:uncharacterized protein LOC117186227 [Drosophila miranda]|uniref:uncharacterized protein LOC117186227 n=1 Tax=Drosophila miranda TaxID=7229 RepID=UPI00143F9B7B|nr:uncharacterized protein LOC117186227 [Drosophila miranda]XP_033242548.1 uncharacterized protein LOC117186227 [Drosophila miranda]